MNDQSYTTTLVVEATPDAAFAAINDVRRWWSQDVEGSTDTVGAEFDYRGNQDGTNVHRARIRVAELVPGRRVVWHVVDNWMGFIEDQAEWKDTRIVFEIAPAPAGAEIRFSHLGLVPTYECFDVCFDAWTFFIQESLRELIAEGRGEPMPRVDPAQRAASA
jgi:uncharacterized protein YndB with AHSA1/START domain